MCIRDRLSLVAQLDFDVLGGRAGPHLPDHGLLQLYLNLDMDSFGGDEFDPVVLWFGDGEALTPRSDGVAQWGNHPVEVDVTYFLSVPSAGLLDLAHWPDDELDAYREAIGDAAVFGQVGGWRRDFQNDPAVSIALREAGLDYADRLGVRHPGGTDPAAWHQWRRDLRAELDRRTDIANWRLVLEQRYSPGLGGDWADGGVAWFMGQQARTTQGDFSNIRGQMASH